MTKKIKNLLLIILFSILIVSCGKNNNINEDEIASLEEFFTDTWAKLEEEEEKTQVEISREKKMEEIKKKLALKWLISKWDMYFGDREYTIALTQYLKVLKDLPNDKDTLKKIWDIYYEQKRWPKAYEYYKKAKDFSWLDTRRAIYSLINSSYNWDFDINEINKEIDSFNLSKQESFYYKNSLICTSNSSKCRANFEEFFKKLWEENEITFNDLEKIKDTLINYENFQLEDLDYKSALVTWTFYTNWFYFVALKTWQNILKNTPDYKPIMKIVAKSAYELWDYNLAKELIISYNKIETNDVDASYFLGRIYEKLWEKVLSSVHFTKALNLWYTDENDIRRRLIFLYYELDDTTKMLNMFKDMLESDDKDLTINDYNLAIHYLIANDELKIAEKYSKEAIEKFKDSELFYTYYAWILLQNEKLTIEQLKTIKENIDKAQSISKESAMLSMVIWIYYMKTAWYDNAEKEFKKAKKLDSTKDYSETIDYWLIQLKNKKNEWKKTK